MDADDDNDGLLTAAEFADLNRDGDPADALDFDSDSVPNYLDPDDDGDLMPTRDEQADPDRDGRPTDAVDSDQDGVPDYLDTAPTSVPVDVPKAIELVSFQAYIQESQLRVRWVTAAEHETLGFWLYGSTQRHFHTASRLKSTIMLTQGAAGGSYYTVLAGLDLQTTGTAAFNVWLVEVELSGRQNRYGPFQATRPSLDAIFLPLILR